MYLDVRYHPNLFSKREKFREFPSATAEPLPPVFCMLCSSNFCRVEDFHVHSDCAHGGLQRYRHVVMHVWALHPFVIPPSFSWASVSNFSEFGAR